MNYLPDCRLNKFILFNFELEVRKIFINNLKLFEKTKSYFI